MKINGITAVLLSAWSAAALVTIGLADPPSDILANAGKFKPTITFSDTYGEKVLTIPAPPPDPGSPRDPATHEQVPTPEKISFKIVANIEGFDLNEIADDLPLSVNVGGYSSGDLTLADSDEALKNGTIATGGHFPAGGKKATFSYIGTFEKPNGDTYDRSVGSLVCSWTKTLLTVTLKVSDIAAAGLPEIAASNYVGLYEDVSPNGSHPSGSVKFADDPYDVSVNFGTLTGARVAYADGKSTTKYQKFGSDAAGTLEEFLLQSVTVMGAADTTAPKITAAVPTQDVDGDGLISFNIFVSDTPAATTASGIEPPLVEMAITTANGDADFITIDPTVIPDFAGKVEYDVVDLALFPGSNTLTITVTDPSGNSTVLTKTVTTTFVP